MIKIYSSWFHWLEVSIGSVNSLASKGDMPQPEPMLTQIYDLKCQRSPWTKIVHMTAVDLLLNEWAISNNDTDSMYMVPISCQNIVTLHEENNLKKKKWPSHLGVNLVGMTESRGVSWRRVQEGLTDQRWSIIREAWGFLWASCNLINGCLENQAALLNVWTL